MADGTISLQSYTTTEGSPAVAIGIKYNYDK